MSAGKRAHGRAGKAGVYITPMLVQAAWSAVKTSGRQDRLVRPSAAPKNPAAVKKAILPITCTQDRLPGAQEREAV